MNAKGLASLRTATAVIFSAVAVFYFLNLPLYVQGGDTGELVAAAYGKFVAHPPGYPLWIWLQHVFLQIPLGGIFWKASLLASLFSCAALLVIGWPLRSPFSLGALLILALSPPFVEAALLPDVFSLHALLVGAIGSFYLFAPSASKRFQLGIPLLFFLGLAHHLTIVLLAPVVISAFWESRKERKFFLGSALGALCAFLLYASLLLLHAESRFSWGNLDSLTLVWHHFLRSDYGTFRLQAGEGSGSIAGLLFFLRSTWIELGAFFSLSALVVYIRRDSAIGKRVWVWLATCLLSIGFFFLANVAPTGMGQEILRRFFVMPLVQFCLLAVYFLRQGVPEARVGKVAWLLILFSLTALAGRDLEYLGLRHDSLFEDYADNLLKQAERHKPALVLAPNDNAYFALRFLQATQGRDLGIAIASPSLFFHPWYLGKIQQFIPTFELPAAEAILKNRTLDIQKDLFAPNQEISWILTKGTWGHSTYLGLGRLVKPGAGIDFDEASLAEVSLRTRYESRPVGAQSFSRGFLYAEYSHFGIAEGIALASQGSKELAKRAWQEALEKVPFAYPALKNICDLEERPQSFCSDDNLRELRAEAAGFF